MDIIQERFMERILPKIGSKYQDYTVISKPYKKNNIWHVKVKCSCGKTKDQPTGGLKKLSCCKRCNASKNYRKYKPGDKKYNLLLIDYAPYSNDKKHTQLIVKCDCGNISTISSSHFGTIKTCRDCFYAKKGKEHPSYRGTKYVPMTYFSQIKVNAKKRNLKFNLNLNFLDKLLKKQDFRCYLSNKLISVHDKTASLDRIDSSLGYIKKNVAWVHKDIQRMKSDFDINYFIQVCTDVNKTYNRIYE